MWKPYKARKESSKRRAASPISLGPMMIEDYL